MQLRAPLFAVLLLEAAARADGSFVAKTQLYVDNDHTTVVSPLVNIADDAWKGGTLSAGWVADVVSSASVDVVSNATRSMSDLRHEVTGAVKQRVRDTTLSGAYIYSVENDYSSHNLALSVAQDLFKHNTTLALGYNLSVNDIGRFHDRAFSRSLLVNGVTATLTQTLTRATLLELSYSFLYDRGYEASPYRFVRIDSPIDGTIEFKVPETLPQSRVRHALVAGVNQHLGSRFVLGADYRAYFDSWGLSAHTVQVRWFVTFGDFTFRLRERFYYQRGADFFRTQYTSDAIPAFVTTDRELSDFWSNVAGAKLSWQLPWWKRRLAAELKADVFYFRYLNYALLQNRVGADLEAGLSARY